MIDIYLQTEYREEKNGGRERRKPTTSSCNVLQGRLDALRTMG